MDDESQIAIFSIPNITPQESHKIAEAITEILDYPVVVISASLETVSLEDLRGIVQSLTSKAKSNE